MAIKKGSRDVRATNWPVDLLADIIPDLVSRGTQIVMLGQGDPILQRQLRHTNTKVLQPKAPIASEQVAKAEQTGDRVMTSDGQQWVVLATYDEEVRTVATPHEVNRSRSATAANFFSDYDGNADASGSEPTAGAAGQGSNAAHSQADNAPNQSSAIVRQFTVTQLILRVVPANQNSSSTSNSKDSKSKSTQPPPASVRGGWFVIQL